MDESSSAIPNAVSNTETRVDGSQASNNEKLTALNIWFEKNSSFVSLAKTGTASVTKSKSESQLVKRFSEVSKVVASGLDIASQVYPPVLPVCLAFKFVISIDGKRRDNNDKVVALKITMTEMAVTLFDLKDVKNLETLALEDLMEQIAQGMREVGSACEVYVKAHFITKAAKAYQFEDQFLDFGKRFTEHRKKLVEQLSIHIVHSLDTAQTKLDAQASSLAIIDGKLDDLKSMFKQFTTQRDKDIQDLLKKRGIPLENVQASLDDELLRELLKMGGEDQDTSATQNKQGIIALNKTKSILMKELTEDIDGAIKQNMKLVETKLDQMKEQLEHGVKLRNEDRWLFLNAMKSGVHDMIRDKDLKEVWQRMDWKGSVKAVAFVLSLQEHFMRTKMSSESLDAQEDNWALHYLDFAHAQPILEAIDDDGTGYISFYEANGFTQSMPKNWSLLRWLAFWSEGWHYSLDYYKQRIYATLQLLHKSVKLVHPLNRPSADIYVADPAFDSLDRILRAIVPFERHHDTYFFSLSCDAEVFLHQEESRLEEQLKRFRYDIEDIQTLEFITGQGRPEKFVLPVTYLLLLRHITVLRIAQTIVLHEGELPYMLLSITNVVNMLYVRKERLRSVFRQTRRDPDKQLREYAYGMFKDLQDSIGDDWNLAANSLRGLRVNHSVRDEVAARVQKQLESHEDKTKMLLLDRTADNTCASAQSLQPDRQNASRDGIFGAWIGYLYDDDTRNDLQGLTIIVLSPSEAPGLISGHAENFTGLFNVTGTITDTDITLKLETLDTEECPVEVLTNEEGQSCVGTLDTESQTLSGKFFGVKRVAYSSWQGEVHKKAVAAPTGGASRFLLRKLTEPLPPAHESDQRRLLELSAKMEMYEDFRELAPYRELTGDEWEEVRELRRILPPSTARDLSSKARLERCLVPVHIYCFCDSCMRTIGQSRFACISCKDSQFMRGVDLCLECRDTTPYNSGFEHLLSHSIMKAGNMLPDVQMAEMILKSRARSASVKTKFRNAIEGSNEKPFCNTCSNPISLPCWVCVECTDGVYICNQCESEENKRKEWRVLSDDAQVPTSGERVQSNLIVASGVQPMGVAESIQSCDCQMGEEGAENVVSEEENQVNPVADDIKETKSQERTDDNSDAHKDSEQESDEADDDVEITHVSGHVLVRIYDTAAEVKEMPAQERRVLQLEQSVSQLEQSVAVVGNRLAAVENSIKRMESVIIQRLESAITGGKIEAGTLEEVGISGP